MWADDIREQARIWPIRIRLPGVTWHSLWATDDGPDPTEVTLAIDRNLLFCRTKKALYELIASDVTFNISQLEKYPIFRQAALDKDKTKYVLTDEDIYDFNKAHGYLDMPDWRQWTLARCAIVLNCFNIMWDMARTAGSERIHAAGVTDKYLHSFLEALTFMTPEEIGVLGTFDQDHIRAIFADDWARISKVSLFIC